MIVEIKVVAASQRVAKRLDPHQRQLFGFKHLIREIGSKVLAPQKDKNFAISVIRSADDHVVISIVIEVTGRTHRKAKSALGCHTFQMKFETMLLIIILNTFVLDVHVNIGRTGALIKGCTYHQVFEAIAIQVDGGQAVAEAGNENRKTMFGART